MRNLRRTIGRVLGALATLLTVAAFVEQLRRPPSERTWHGRIYGVPYDFRPPTLERARQRWWNPDDPSLFTPRTFGVGWDINLYRLLHLVAKPGS